MFGTTETQCIETIMNFIKDNPRFRPITLEDEGELLKFIDYKKAFVLVKGSYKAKDVVLGMMLNYDITSTGTSGSGVNIFYRLLCNPIVEARFTRETDDNRVMKKIGPCPEVQIGDQLMDESFIIETKKIDKLKELLNNSSLKKFLLEHLEVLEFFHLGTNRIEYQRSFEIEKFSTDCIEKDLDELSEVTSTLNSESENLL